MHSTVCAKKVSLLNKTIKEIYISKDVDVMRATFCRAVASLFSCKIAAFILEDTPEHRNNPIGYGNSAGSLVNYRENYFDTDFASWLFQCGDSFVFRKSEIFTEEQIKKSKFYQDMVKPNHLRDPLITIISINHKFVALISLFRTEEDEDFTEEDKFLMELLKEHIETRLLIDKIRNKEQQKVLNTEPTNLFLEYQLTPREVQIIKYVYGGYSNDQIATTLFIDVTTVKKHITNIYRKLAIQTRRELLEMNLVARQN